MRARRPPARGNSKRNTSAAAIAVDGNDPAGTDAPNEAAPRTIAAAASTSKTMSVSPHRPREPSRTTSATPMPTNDIVISPRVLDQRAFDDLSDKLQQRIAQSQELAGELARQVEAAAAIDTQANRASTRLQDRLLLSARMLKALQVQMDKLQGMQDEFNVRSSAAERAQAAHIASLDAHRVKLGTQLNEQVHGAEAKLASLDDTITRLTDLVVQSEKSITAVAHRAAQSAQRAEHVVEDAKRTLRQCEEARQHLAKDLLDAEERLTESARRADELATKVQNAVARSTAAEQQFCRVMEVAGPFIAQLDRLEQSVLDVNSLLPRLSPWEPILLNGRTEPHALPAPLRELVEAMRAGMRSEMRQLAGSMRGLAERMETMSSSSLAVRQPDANDKSGQLEDVPVEPGVAEIVTLPGVALSALGSRRPAEATASTSADVATANGASSSL